MTTRLPRSSAPTACILALTALTASAAPQTWGVQFGTQGYDEPSSILPDGTGGTFLAGNTVGSLFGPTMGGADVYVLRAASDGTQLWATQFGTPGYDLHGDLLPDGLGGLFVVGSCEPAGIGTGPDGFLARMDGQGNVLWTVYEGTPGYDLFTAVASDGAGGVFAVGITEAPSGGLTPNYLWVVRFDSAGGVLWSKSHNLFGEVVLYDAVADGQGGLFVGGSRDIIDPDGFVCRISPTGSLMWTRSLGSIGHDQIRGVAQDESGGVFATGYTSGDLAGSHGDRDIVLARYDGLGVLQWLKQFGTSALDAGSDASADGLGGVMLTGTTSGELAGANDGGVECWLMAVDSTGTVTWSDQFGSSGSVYAGRACVVGPQTVVVAGTTWGAEFGPHQGNADVWVASRDISQPQPPTNYCVASPNSAGPGATIAFSGTTDLSYDDLELSVAGCPAGQIGLFIMGPQTASAPFGNGVLCLGGSISRLLPGQATNAGGAASLALDPDDPNSSASKIEPGSTWNFQFWYRDPDAGGALFNLSNALSATFCP